MEQWEVILRGHKKLRKLLQNEAEKLGLTYTDVQVLYSLSSGEKNVSTLAKLVDVNKSTMVEVLDKLEKMGYIKKSKNEQDKRVVIIKVTEEGLNILTQVRTRYKDLILTLLDKVENKECVLAFFNAIIDQAEKQSLSTLA
ncbi:MarR family winged helix-turn-helix transcriptional regulator [Sulfolobus acidocaldarius]|uniref:HTH-type transcriptional regulator MgrA n=4 Tax=Sulfolobus acidocaldarius TaxID=2285 RepID=Q4J8A1_SULAC|nr:MarR family transcriptional regulator [Sulfolobus acidocaldarius]AAY80980.1 transcriptional regulator MarR family [Sulfolobus acidocaldarius DSM 639]AGE71581.1 MarR family transcriptional regulator [Sulfolobus acidocaldarius N8]AGE73854.1 MarR family transcriptional regulator [Sulfolobus acidocaldarius Ron12/I]ALU30194.1 MarR family transcriptional regulator [Sulfolobus acidocaldarius]ALU30909.1 MarR family transcriptional regulator [Sulfolobus acidocaldarius]